MLYLVLALALTALAIAITAVFRMALLQKRLNAVLGGTAPDALEAVLAGHMKRVETVDHRLAELDQRYDALSVAASLASQKISIVRFNPFGDTGGDQSFTLAVLDAHDSGYVLTSIHGREGTRVYVKPIDYAKSKYTLSDEEQQALRQAIARVPQELSASDKASKE